MDIEGKQIVSHIGFLPKEASGDPNYSLNAVLPTLWVYKEPGRKGRRV